MKRSVFITGAATGIGAGLVSKLANEDWQVFAGYRSSRPEAASWYEHPNVTPIKCDIVSIDDIENSARQISDATGDKLDLLINNAGFFTSGGVVEDADLNAYRKAMDINLYGALDVLKAFMPLVRKGSYPTGGKGRVINVASSSTLMTFPMASAYTVSKQAFKTASFHLRLEMAPFGIQVATLDPGGVDTPMSGDKDDNANTQWSAIPNHLRAQYQEHFIDAETMMNNNQSLTMLRPDEFADKIYRKIIISRHFKPLYVIGPGATAMPWLHRLLPRQQVENIWAGLFRRKR